MNKGDFSQPQRQNRFAILVYWFEFMRRFFYHGIYGLIPLIIEPGIWWILFILLFLALIATGFLALLAYYHFEFYLTDSELVILQGLFVKQRSNIPFERIQTVHLHQNVIQRITGVKGLKVDTAGSQMQETEIKGLKDDLARELKNALKASAKGITPEEEAEQATSETSAEQQLVSLNLRDLSLVALTDNHFKNGGIILGFLVAVVSQLFPNQSLVGMLTDLQWYPFAMKSVVLKTLYAGVIFAGVVLLVAFIKHLHFYYAFESSLTSEGFQAKGGLLRRNEYTVPFSKIQFLEWKTNFIRQRMGMHAISIYPAQSAAGNNLSTVTIPGCFSEHSEQVMTGVFPKVKDAEPLKIVKPSNFYKLYLLNIRIVIGLLAAGILSYMWSPLWSGILLALYIIFQAIAVPRYVNSVFLEIFDNGIVYKRGWLFPQKTVFEPHKLQAVKIRQNILQKRRSLCHLIMGTAAGHIRIPFLHVSEVMPIYNWLTYKVEIYRGSWM